MNDITIVIHDSPCPDTDCSSHHPNIRAYEASVHLHSHRIGHVKVYVLDKAAMTRTSLNRMWEECQDFDARHDGTKLDKIENFLSNESLVRDWGNKVEEAEAVLFIDRVWLEAKFRRQGRGLMAVRKTIEALRVPAKTVVMLQAGDVGGLKVDCHDAGEKLTRYWKRLGFAEWSESDESWLLLWLEDVD